MKVNFVVILAQSVHFNHYSLNLLLSIILYAHNVLRCLKVVLLNVIALHGVDYMMETNV